MATTHAIYASVSFRFNETPHLIQITTDTGIVHIQALTADHEPCGFEYTVTLPQDYYMEALLQTSVVAALIDAAKRDIVDDRANKDLTILENAIVAKCVSSSDDWQSRPGFIAHTDVFDRPITKRRYQEFLERMNYFGFPIEGYGVGDVVQADDTGEVWIYQHSRSCD